MNTGSNSTKRNNEDDVILEGNHGNGAKKAYHIVDSSARKFRRVLHLRGLPIDATEREAIKLGLAFGKVKNLLMLKSKNQAFLEMENEDDAQQMVDANAVNPPTIRQRNIYIQFSNHKELKTDNSPGQQQAQALIHAMQQSEGGINHVLRVVVENRLYPITVEVLHKIFKRFGTVLKIIIFTKNGQLQALIQMADAVESQTAKLSLDGQNIYNNCCTLRIEYSKLTQLNVKYNNDKSFDFTRDDLPSGDGGGSLLGGPGGLPNPGGRGAGGGPGMMPTPFRNQGGLGNVLQQSQLASIASRATTNALAAAGIQPSVAAALAAQLVGGVSQMANPGQPMTSVLHVTNLNEEAFYDDGLSTVQNICGLYSQSCRMVTPQVLFTLFGVYGDVWRVKILFQRKDSALVQMADPSQAELVINNLDGAYLFNQPLQIRFSKHNQIQMPREGQDHSKLTQDFTNSLLHRFKKPGSKNFQNIFPPSDTLHLSNIPPEIDEDFLKDAFSEHGNVKEFKFFAKDRRMALIKLANKAEAINCLVHLHNFKLTDSNHLRVTFSKGHINKTY